MSWCKRTSTTQMMTGDFAGVLLALVARAAFDVMIVARVHAAQKCFVGLSFWFKLCFKLLYAAREKRKFYLLGEIMVSICFHVGPCDGLSLGPRVVGLGSSCPRLFVCLSGRPKLMAVGAFP